MKRFSRQRGLTVVELMVGLLVGMLVVAGVLSVYLSTLESSGSTLKSSRLNQEMSALLNIMANDIRRAGYWGNADFTNPQDNPFNRIDSTAANTTALRVHNNSSGAYVDVTYHATLANRVGSCVVYTYDADADGTLDNNEKYGFRWDGTGNAIRMRTSGTGGTNQCASNNDNWDTITDTSTTTITGLSFDLSNTKCLNVAEPDGEEDGGAAGTADDPLEYDCYTVTPDTDNKSVEVREVLITLSAELADDPSVKATMSQTVQVRNNLVRVWP
jgi:type IV pilus assembly protein PilW